MDSPARKLKQSLHSNAMVIGDKVFFQALFAGGEEFVFTQHQMEFLWALQQMKAVQAAALAVGKDEEWANRFLDSKKFSRFRSAKIQEASLRNGLTIEWWYEFGKKLTEGEQVDWTGTCGPCGKRYHFNAYEIAEKLTDDLGLTIACENCGNNLELKRDVIPFKPTREQVEGWKELGSRLTPKIERIHHQFENVDIVFENGGD